MIRFQQTPATFFVEEELLYQPSGTGRYVFLRIRKQDCSTIEAKRRIARWAGINKDRIRHAGMKDRASTSIQWLSWEAGSKALPMEAPPELIEILDCTYHENNLSIGHVCANRFRIILETDGCPAPMDQLKMPFPNFYGPQRFGRMDLSREEVTARLARPIKDRHLISALQSWLFNRFLVDRLAHRSWEPAEDELWTKSNGKRVFQFPWDEELAQRFKSGELMPTGPVFGYKMQINPTEENWLKGFNMTTESFRPWGSIAKGARRPMLVLPAIHEIQQSDTQIVLDFTLPSGSYATIYLMHAFMPDRLWQEESQWPDFTESTLLQD